MSSGRHSTQSSTSQQTGIIHAQEKLVQTLLRCFLQNTPCPRQSNPQHRLRPNPPHHPRRLPRPCRIRGWWRLDVPPPLHHLHTSPHDGLLSLPLDNVHADPQTHTAPRPPYPHHLRPPTGETNPNRDGHRRGSRPFTIVARLTYP